MRYKKYIISFVWLIIGLAISFEARAQSDLVGGATLFHDLNSGVGENLPILIPVTHTNQPDPLPNCNAVIGAISQDSWFNVISNNTGLVAFSVTPTSGANLAIAIYDGAGSAVNLLNCANLYTTTDLSTETVLISAISGNTYTVRLMNLSAVGAYNATISIYSGPIPQRDLCSSAVSVAIGTCDFTFNVENDYVHNEANSLAVGCDLLGTIQADGWLKIDLIQNKRVRIEYQNADKNAVLQAFKSTTGSCGNLMQLACANAVPAFATPEVLEFTATEAGTQTYYIRIGNLSDNATMTGEICITEVLERDNCADLATHPAEIKLGDCGVRVFIDGTMPTVFDANDSPGCYGSVAANVWIKHVATAARIRLEFNANENIRFVVTTVGCPGTEIVGSCFTASGPSAAVSFDVTIGVTYYISLASTDAGVDATGFLCLYEDAKKSEDVFYAANVIDATGQDCGKTFNILDIFEEEGSKGALVTGFPNPIVGCGGNSIKDVWGAFQTSGTLPTSGLIVEYDNNDGRSSTTPADVVLQVYKGGAVNIGTIDYNTCAAALGSATTVNLNSFAQGLVTNTGVVLPLPTCGVGITHEKWVRYQHNVASGNVLVAFKSNSPADFALEVYTDCTPTVVLGAGSCGAKGDIFPDLAQREFNAMMGNVYLIRVLGVGIVTGDLSVNMTSQLVFMGCSNSLIEGNETVLLSSASPSPFIANTQYYFRAIALSAVNGSLVGRACIRDNAIPTGDLCANVQAMLVGDCDIQFNLTGDVGGEDRFVNTQTVPGGGFPSASVGRDGWLSFTATTSKTTVEYTQDLPTQDAAIEVYRGTCAVLNRISDATNGGVFVDAFVSPATGVEKFVITTIPGVLYYVRIIKKGASSDLLGNLCIYNTVARDACIDNDLLTLYVGDCNVTVDVPRSFDSDKFPAVIPPLYLNFLTNLPAAETAGSLLQFVETSCEVPFNPTAINNNPTQLNSRDGWFRFIGNGNEVTMNFTTSSAVANPSIVVYTALKSVGPINCGTGLSGVSSPNSGNQYACANNILTNTPQTESVTFRTNGGQQYLVRIIDLNAALGIDMTGSFCISDGRNNYNNPCTTSITGPRSVAIGSCTIPLNVANTGATACFIPTTSIVGGNYDDDVAGTTCDNCVNRDAWAVIVRPFVCDPTVTAPTPTTELIAGGTIISCPKPFRVNLGANGAIGGGDDKCECGSNPTNNCTPPPLADSPTPGLELVAPCSCAAGYVCYDDDGNYATTADRKCVPAGYEYKRGANNLFDINGFDDFFSPIATNGRCPNPYSVNLGTDNAIGGAGINADFCVCAQQTIRLTHPNVFTIEYDNRNGVSDIAADYSMLVYQTTNCDDENFYTRLACLPAVQPLAANVERVEKYTTAVLPMTHGSGGETYFVRVLNKSLGKTLLGNMCVYYGVDAANQSCLGFPLNDYGQLEGEFKNFTVSSETIDANRNLPSTTIPSCVLAGMTSSPATQGPNPIRADAWMQFTVPAGSNYNNVSVQFDNTNSASLRNVAIAVYTSPEIPTGTTNTRDNGTTNLTLNCRPYGAADPNPANTPNRGGLFLLDCQNAVLSGSETSTINTTYTNGALPAAVPTSIDRTYYVRVMNVHNESTPTAFVGRIRVFPAAACTLGGELIQDGDFNMWPAISYPSGVPDNTIGLPNTLATMDTYYNMRNAAVIRIPNITTADPYPNDIDGVFGASSGAAVNTGVARYATDYGYVRENGTYLAGGQTILFSEARRSTELNPEGLYTIRHSPWTLKQNWFCFGVGYSGYGGRNPDSLGEPQAIYCTSGTLGLGSEACGVVSLENGTITTLGTFNTALTTNATNGLAYNNNGDDGLPAPFPTTGDANFMVVNGSWLDVGGLPAGKIWCQTIPRLSTDVNDVGYYIFSIWVQNMKQIGSNSEVPQMRLTVCDMESPSSPGSFPTERDIYSTANGDTGSNDLRMTRLPGITDVAKTTGAFDDANSSSGVGISAEENPAQRVRHLPLPGPNRLFAVSSGGTRQPSYGAAMHCNLTSGNGWSGVYNVNESSNTRLKVLGSSFLVPERPDNWVLIRCIYRAPRTVKEMNLCIENLSLTKNGNDFGVDKISFQKCLSADAETFDRLLKGDPCSLSTDGKVTGIPLTATLLDLSTRLLGDKVAVIWSTVNENQTSHYEVQRSNDGANFITLANVDAKNNLQGYNNYEWIDINLPIGVKTIYYRLIIRNKDSYEKATSIVSVDVPTMEYFDLKLKPNPIARGEEVTLQFHATQKGQASITVVDMMGNHLMKQIVETTGNTQEVILKTGFLKAGLYIVQMNQNGKTASKKLLVN